MAGAFREQLRQWGSQCEILGKPVRIRLRTDVHGSPARAYQEARRIVTSFASLRTWERNNTRKRFTRELGTDTEASRQMPMRTPYESVICRIVRLDACEGYEVHFIREDDPIIGQMFEELGDDGEPLPFTPVTRQIDLSEFNSTGTKPEVSNDPNDIPLDVDPFSGERL